jgi:hypothetical protein
VRDGIYRENPRGGAPVQQRYSLRETAAYLKTSLPRVRKLINEDMLEAFKEGSRTFLTGRSIAVAPNSPGSQVIFTYP